MEVEYRRYVQTINQLEKRAQSGDTSAKTVSQLRDAYSRLLASFPLLEGFWIRLAHTEFRLTNSTQASIAVFEQALETCNLKYSLAIWVSYLQFLTRIANCGLEHLEQKFELASKFVGSHFLSHELWDLYLEIHPSPVRLLLYILDHLTIHQFSKYYAQLVTILENGNHTEDFRDVMPAELQESAINEEELPQLQQVIMSRLKLRYELHSRRVKHVLKFEQSLRRPFYYPRPSPDMANWRGWIEAKVDTLPVFHRALIPCGDDPQMWIAYVRYHHAQKLSADKIVAAYQVPVARRMVPVMLHYALWLELNGDFERAEGIYSDAERTKKDQSVVAMQYAQFLSRRSETERARQKLLRALEIDPKNADLADQLAAASRNHDYPQPKTSPVLDTVEEIVSKYDS